MQPRRVGSPLHRRVRRAARVRDRAARPGWRRAAARVGACADDHRRDDDADGRLRAGHAATPPLTTQPVWTATWHRGVVRAPRRSARQHAEPPRRHVVRVASRPRPPAWSGRRSRSTARRADVIVVPGRRRPLVHDCDHGLGLDRSDRARRSSSGYACITSRQNGTSIDDTTSGSAPTTAPRMSTRS